NNVRIVTKVNRVTGKVSVEPGELTFDLNVAAHLSMTIEGTPARQIDDPRDPGNVIQTFTNIPFDPGHYQMLLIPQFQVALPGVYHYTLTALDDQGNLLLNSAGQPVVSTGEIDHELEVDGSFPIGHTMIHGVDLWDGHLTQSTQDVLVPGRGLSLDFTRYYSSTGSSGAGPLGAGWTHSYNIRLTRDPADGTFTIKGGDGTTFDTDSAHTDAARAGEFGVPAGALFYHPQLGYHSTLVQPDPNNGTQLDYYSKDHTRYHFVVDPSDSSGKTYRLVFIEDPNGNTINLIYEASDPRIANLPGLRQEIQQQIKVHAGTLDAV